MALFSDLLRKIFPAKTYEFSADQPPRVLNRNFISPMPEDGVIEVPTGNSRNVLGTSARRETPVQAVQAPVERRKIDTTPYQGMAAAPPPLPSQAIQDMIWQHFPNEATPAAVALAGENAGFRDDAYNYNNDGTGDYGLFQNNSKTFTDLLSKAKYGNVLRDNDLRSVNDITGNPEASILTSMLTRQYEDDAGVAPWSWWYGWQDKGYTIDPDKSVEDLAAMEYESGAKPYFRSQNFLNNR